MDFDQAIAAHSSWKAKLHGYLSQHDGSLKSAEVAADNKCPLGKWIHGEGLQHSKLPEYSTLTKEHARFHTAAADIVRKADSGQAINEDAVMGSRSEFTTASSAVVLAILAMKKKVQAK